MAFESILEIIESTIATYGMPQAAFIFLLSFISNSIPFAAIPYLYVLLVISSVGNFTIEQLILLAFVSSIGAALGKLIVYFLSRSVRIFLSEKKRENVETLKKILSKGIFLAVFIFAMTPLPDDIINIPAGLMGFNLVKYFIAVTLGKTILTFSVLLFGSVGAFISRELGELNVIFLSIYIVITVLLSIIIIKVDWAKVVSVYNEKGLSESIREVIEQIPKTLGLRRT